MEYRLDSNLDATDTADDDDGKLYGWNKAVAGEAYTNASGDVVLSKVRDEFGVINRLADAAEAAGVRAYWRQHKFAS